MAPQILLRCAAALLLATAVFTRFEHARATTSGDPCTDVDQACSADTNCTTCRDAVGANTAAYEECQLNYGYFDDNLCIIQAAAPCCQNEATSVDCLANAAYTDFYDCRLLNDVGGDCTGLNCDAVGQNVIETTDDDDDDDDVDAATDAPETGDESEELDTAADNGAGLVAPPSLAGSVFVMVGLCAGAAKVAAAFG